MAKPRRKVARDRKQKRTASRDMPELRQARALWIQNRFQSALTWFDRAVRKEPGNAMALCDAARAFGARFEIERAERLLGRLVELGERRADFLQMAGQSYRMIQRPWQAIDCLERALRLDSSLLEPRMELAILYERRNRLDEAMAQVSSCLEQFPDSMECRFLKGRVLRRQGCIEESEQVLRDVASSSRAHGSVRAQAYAELGQLLDKSSEYEAAMQAIVSGKEILRQDAEPHVKRAREEARHLENVMDELTVETLSQWRDSTSGPGSDQVALLTGPPRSGTTLLEKALDAHPKIVTSDEQVAFPKFIYPSMLQKTDEEVLSIQDLTQIPGQRIQQEQQRYLRFLAEARGEAMAGRFHIDKNPSTVMLIPGFLRLWWQARLLIAIRDPRDVVMSCFMRYLPLNSVSVQFLDLESACARYARDIRAWWKLRELLTANWLEVKYEDTVEDLRGTTGQVLTFLGLDWSDSVMEYRQLLDRKPANSPTYEDVQMPIYQDAIGRWQNYEPFLAPYLERLQPFVESYGY